jgi:hypothetical protein
MLIAVGEANSFMSFFTNDFRCVTTLETLNAFSAIFSGCFVESCELYESN